VNLDRRFRVGAVLCLLSMSLGSGVAQSGEDRAPYPHGTFRADCTGCHAANSWSPPSFKESWDHGEFGFPLAQGHSGVECRDCHASLDFSKATAACVGCHFDRHEGVLGADCSRCHSTREFRDRVAFLRMHELTSFPLPGAHATVDCEACHAGGADDVIDYTLNTPVTCDGCHLSDYESTQDPDHVAAGFPTDCTQCHSLVGWEDGDFDHAFFPLTDGHGGLPCGQCHVGGVYEGTSADCYVCHQADFEGVEDPDHVAAGFPTDCLACHTTAQWQGAQFDHDAMYFPIYTGKHREAWDSCADCHLNPGNYGTFCCTNCHEHNQGDTDDDHDEVSGYQYNCTSCFSCHPDGSD